MALTPEQRAHAQAWASVFPDSASVNAVLDDLQQYARTLADPLERAGATSLILFILVKRSQLRRAKGKERSSLSIC